MKSTTHVVHLVRVVVVICTMLKSRNFVHFNVYLAVSVRMDTIVQGMVNVLNQKNAVNAEMNIIQHVARLVLQHAIFNLKSVY